MGILDFLGMGKKQPAPAAPGKTNKEAAMFCYQCEQAANGGCSVVGVCGKQPEVAALQDLLVYSLKGIAFWADKARQAGKKDQEIDRFMIDGLFATVTNVDFDADAIAKLVAEAVRLRGKAKQLAGATGGAGAGRGPGLGPARRPRGAGRARPACTASRTSPSMPTSTRCASSSPTASRATPPTPTMPGSSARNRTRSTPSPTRRWRPCSTTAST